MSLEAGIAETTRLGLARLGHRTVEAIDPHGGGQAIFIDWRQGVLHGGSDPRKDGMAAAY